MFLFHRRTPLKIYFYRRLSSPEDWINIWGADHPFPRGDLVWMSTGLAGQLGNGRNRRQVEQHGAYGRRNAASGDTPVQDHFDTSTGLTNDLSGCLGKRIPRPCALS